jgi:hypothetical protein
VKEMLNYYKFGGGDDHLNLISVKFHVNIIITFSGKAVKGQGKVMRTVQHYVPLGSFKT